MIFDDAFSEQHVSVFELLLVGCICVLVNIGKKGYVQGGGLINAKFLHKSPQRTHWCRRATHWCHES